LDIDPTQVPAALSMGYTERSMADLDLAKIKQLDGGLLLVLRELLRQRRVTLAAQRLGLSQSAVSHALSRLRELFDDALFVRTAAGLEPTRHALDLAPRIEGLLSAMHDAMGLPAQFEPSESTRTFRVGAPDYLSRLLAPGLFKCFTTCAPRARFVIHQRLGRDAQRALLRDELDVAIGRFAECEADVAMEELFEDRYCLVARRDHPKLRAGLDAERYAQLQHVQVSVTADFRVPEFMPPRAPGLYGVPRVVAAVPRFWIAFSMVAQTDAVTIAPEQLALQSAPEHGLRIHALPFAVQPIVIFAARRARADAGTHFLLQQLRLALAPVEGAPRKVGGSDAA
jgi:DNA-binding transcriptional LysR family regulator